MPFGVGRTRGQAPKPRSGAPQAQGLTATPRSAARSGVPSLAIRHAKSLSSTKAVAPQAISATQRIYTSLTGTTPSGSKLESYGSHDAPVSESPKRFEPQGKCSNTTVADLFAI